jgi:hypothetical protein
VSTGNGAWKPKLREILADFDQECLHLSASSATALRNELATQIEYEILRFSDVDKEAVLALALKHFDAAGQWKQTVHIGAGSPATGFQRTKVHRSGSTKRAGGSIRRAFSEPTLAELLDDPIIQPLTSSDGVNPMRP